MSPAMLVLHAVRLAGVASAASAGVRAGLDDDDRVLAYLEVLEEAGLVERFAFGGDVGWVVTQDGRDRDTAALRAEAAAAGATALLGHAVDRFEEVNGEFVRVVTAWQLGAAGTATADVVPALRDLTTRVEDLLDEVSAVLPRFTRYPRQLAEAVEHAAAGRTEWVAGVGRLSAHTVWAELHQDLLTTTGRERGA